MTPPIHVGLAQHPIKTGRGRGLSHLITLGKVVLVLLQEGYECLTDWLASEGANPGSSLRFGVVEEDLL